MLPHINDPFEGFPTRAIDQLLRQANSFQTLLESVPVVSFLPLQIDRALEDVRRLRAPAEELSKRLQSVVSSEVGMLQKQALEERLQLPALKQIRDIHEATRRSIEGLRIPTIEVPAFASSVLSSLESLPNTALEETIDIAATLPSLLQKVAPETAVSDSGVKALASSLEQVLSTREETARGAPLKTVLMALVVAFLSYPVIELSKLAFSRLFETDEAAKSVNVFLLGGAQLNELRVSKRDVVLYSKKSKNSPPLGVVPKNAVVVVVAKRRNWALIYYQDPSGDLLHGWVFARYLLHIF